MEHERSGDPAGLVEMLAGPASVSGHNARPDDVKVNILAVWTVESDLVLTSETEADGVMTK